MFKKGVKRAAGAGRRKGTPNKRTTSAQAIAERLGINPFEVLLHFANNDWKALGYDSETYTKFSQGEPFEVKYIEPEVRMRAAKEASEYLYPKRKAIELSSEDPDSLPQIIVTIPSNGREAK